MASENGRTSITISKSGLEDIADIKPDGIDWEPFLKQAARAWEDEYGDQWE